MELFESVLTFSITRAQSTSVSMFLSKRSSLDTFVQGNFPFTFLCSDFHMPEEYISRLQGLGTYIYTQLTQLGDICVTILGSLTMTKGRQTPLEIFSSSTCTRRAAFKESIKVKMENIATDLSEREIKRATLAHGKNEQWMRGFFLAEFAF